MPKELAQFLPIILLVVAMYFLMIRPQIKRQKELKNLLDNLNKGDEVVTIGGVLGKITQLNDTNITLEVAKDVEIVVQRTAVSMQMPKGTLKAL